MAILHYGFTVNDCRFALKLGSGADNAGIAVAPIISISAKHTRLPALNKQLGAVAIMLEAPVVGVTEASAPRVSGQAGGFARGAPPVDEAIYAEGSSCETTPDRLTQGRGGSGRVGVAQPGPRESTGAVMLREETPATESTRAK